jgi:hypothetical protein
VTPTRPAVAAGGATASGQHWQAPPGRPPREAAFKIKLWRWSKAPGLSFAGASSLSGVLCTLSTSTLRLADL